MSMSVVNDESPIRCTPVRRIRIKLEGPINFRDLGGPAALGGAVRHGVAYRADGLHTMTLADLETVFGRLGVTRVIDLRSEDERSDPGIGLLADAPAENHHVPILDQTSSVWAGGTVRLADLYRSMLEASADRFARAVHLIARADGPVVFHCAAGKDRTGLVAALVLGLLGVDDRDICEDYAATGEVAAQLRQRIETMAADPRYAERFAAVRGRPDWPELVEEITSAHYSTMAALLDEIRSTDGTITSWALRNGVAASDIAHLHRRLVVVRP
ncbi:MAG: tyrosine-protein phosphatase [Acidimicrobiia bacterium]|nr:tyrosine-protein phosphatase [Acidimicrobiia bacterium]